MIQRALGLFAAIIAAGTIAVAARAADYPNRPITLVVPYGAGGSVTDILARILAEPMKDALGQPVVVENKPGAGGAVGFMHLRGQKPDGYTIILGTSGTLIQRPLLYNEPRYDASEFTPLARAAYIAPFVLVGSNNLKANSFKDFVAYVASNETFFATGNDPSALAAAEFLNWKNLKAKQIAYNAEGKALQEGIYAGQVPWMFLSLPIAREHVTAKKIKAFAMLGEKRHATLPDVPTIGELGAPELTQRLSWLGFFAPKGTPDDVSAKIAAAVHSALKRPDIQDKVLKMNLEPSFADAAAFEQTVKKDAAYFEERIGVLRKKKLLAERK